MAPAKQFRGVRASPSRWIMRRQPREPRKVLRRHALEAHHPALKAALVGVDVLDVIAADCPLARAGDECHLRDAGSRREHLIGLVAVSHEYGVLGYDGLEVRADRFCAEVCEHRVGGLAVTIPHDQDGVMLVGGKPDFLALPPRFLGARPTSLREPLADLRMNVSSASTMPVTAFAFLSLATARNR